MLIAIEGADGAGKRTAAETLSERLEAEGLRAPIVSFPRYGATTGGAVLGDFLGGRLAAAPSPQALAVLYALDRLESKAFLAEVMVAADVVIIDRYTASNMAYQAAKVPQGDAVELMNWIRDLEQVIFALPAASVTFYLDTPLDVAIRLVAQKQGRDYTDRVFDEHEADYALQSSVRKNYTWLAANDRSTVWRTVRSCPAGRLRSPSDIADEMMKFLTASQFVNSRHTASAAIDA